MGALRSAGEAMCSGPFPRTGHAEKDPKPVPLGGDGEPTRNQEPGTRTSCSSAGSASGEGEALCRLVIGSQCQTSPEAGAGRGLCWAPRKRTPRCQEDGAQAQPPPSILQASLLCGVHEGRTHRDTAPWQGVPGSPTARTRCPKRCLRRRQH